MAKQKTSEKLRSKTTENIFDEFVAALRSEKSIDEGIADRLDATLKVSDTITLDKLKDALFVSKPHKEI